MELNVRENATNVQEGKRHVLAFIAALHYF
jgi:hypothetical protein